MIHSRGRRYRIEGQIDSVYGVDDVKMRNPEKEVQGWGRGDERRGKKKKKVQG
jgi:hypothetical protein